MRENEIKTDINAQKIYERISSIDMDKMQEYFGRLAPTEAGKTDAEKMKIVGEYAHGIGYSFSGRTIARESAECLRIDPRAKTQEQKDECEKIADNLMNQEKNVFVDELSKNNPVKNEAILNTPDDEEFVAVMESTLARIAESMQEPISQANEATTNLFEQTSEQN